MENARQQAVRERRLRDFMARQGLGAYLLTRRHNFAWFTGGGDNHVGLATEQGAASILVTAGNTYLLASNIEAGRVKAEELAGRDYDCCDYLWYDGRGQAEAFRRLTAGLRVGSDDGAAGTQLMPITELHYPLLADEVRRYRWLGREAARALSGVARRLRPGWTEQRAAGALADDLLARGITPSVLLVAADQRARAYRHPIPTSRRIRKYVMLVACGQRWGLIVSLTRLVHFGCPPAELAKRQRAVAMVDATYLLSSRPGARIGDVFVKARQAYAASGYAQEWTLHHQGGPTGYLGREYRVTENSDEILAADRALAWNPSIAGAKSEDTMIVRPGRPLILTVDSAWPTCYIKTEGGGIDRPDILVRGAG